MWWVAVPDSGAPTHHLGRQPMTWVALGTMSAPIHSPGRGPGPVAGGPVPWAGAVGWCRGLVPWAGAVGRCRGLVPWAGAGAVGRCRGLVPWAGAVGRAVGWCRGPGAGGPGRGLGRVVVGWDGSSWVGTGRRGLGQGIACLSPPRPVPAHQRWTDPRGTSPPGPPGPASAHPPPCLLARPGTAANFPTLSPSSRASAGTSPLSHQHTRPTITHIELKSRITPQVCPFSPRMKAHNLRG